MPAVSVCMPAHRDSDTFREALRSVLDQPFRDLEVVVSDDSGGDLRAVVEGLGDPRVRYFANPTRLGFARNHTATLDRCEGELLAFLHDDDVWLPEYLPTVTALFAAEPDLGLVSANHWIDHGGGLPYGRRPNPPPGGRHDDWLPLVMRHNTFIPSSTVLRRETWAQVRDVPWPEVVIGDVVMWIEAALRGIPMRWVDEPLVVYRMHPGQVSANETDHREALVTVFGGYAFDDPEAETERRSRLAHALIARAGVRLRGGAVAPARADLEQARGLHRGRDRRRRQLYTLLARVPWLLPPAIAAWRRLRGRPADAT